MAKQTGIVIGAIAVVAAGITGVVLLGRKKTTTTPTPSTAAQFTINGVSLSSQQSGGNFLISMQVSLTNTGTAAGATTVSATAQANGQSVGSFKPQTTAAIQPNGQGNAVIIGTIPSTVTQAIQITVTESQSGATYNTTFNPQSAPALFEIVSVSIPGQPITAGNYATAQVTIKNVGGAGGTVSVTGVDTLNGQVVGHFV